MSLICAPALYIINYLHTNKIYVMGVLTAVLNGRLLNWFVPVCVIINVVVIVDPRLQRIQLLLLLTLTHVVGCFVIGIFVSVTFLFIGTFCTFILWLLLLGTHAWNNFPRSRCCVVGFAFKSRSWLVLFTLLHVAY